MNELHLFAGAGGGILAGQLLGHKCVCAVEYEPYAQAVLVARQNDGTFPPFPIWDDVRTFDGRPWRGVVDVVAGGFPCKGISTTGPGNGFDHPETALWREQARIICEVEPIYAYMENSAALSVRGLDIVLWDLATMGFDAKWGVLSGAACGAPHERERIWILATHPDRAQRKGGKLSGRENQEYANTSGGTWWKDKPGIHGVDDGMAHRSHRLKAIGNGQIPIVASTAWEILKP